MRTSEGKKSPGSWTRPEGHQFQLFLLHRMLLQFTFWIIPLEIFNFFFNIYMYYTQRSQSVYYIRQTDIYYIQGSPPSSISLALLVLNWIFFQALVKAWWAGTAPTLGHHQFCNHKQKPHTCHWAGNVGCFGSPSKMQRKMLSQLQLQLIAVTRGSGIARGGPSREPPHGMQGVLSSCAVPNYGATQSTVSHGSISCYLGKPSKASPRNFGNSWTFQSMPARFCAVSSLSMKVFS